MDCRVLRPCEAEITNSIDEKKPKLTFDTRVLLYAKVDHDGVGAQLPGLRHFCTAWSSARFFLLMTTAK